MSPSPISPIRRAGLHVDTQLAVVSQLVQRLYGCERRLLDIPIPTLGQSTKIVVDVCLELEAIREDLKVLGTNHAQGTP